MLIRFVIPKSIRRRSGFHNKLCCSLLFFLTTAAGSAFENTGPLVNARAYHTATRLLDGTVLVAGGSGGPNVHYNTAEIYDPTTGKWSLNSGHLVTTRSGHTANLLPSGEVLVAGGAVAEIYDPVSRTWRATGSPNAGRGAHTATLLKSGKVLIIGGTSNGRLVSAELYDPSTGSWSLTSPPATTRFSHTATLLPNGKVLVTGGFGATNGPDITPTS